MKNTKRITAIILSALMTVSAFSTLSVSAATVDSNAPVALADFQSQNDIKWNIDLNGTLHISGSGIITKMNQVMTKKEYLGMRTAIELRRL